MMERTIIWLDDDTDVIGNYVTGLQVAGYTVTMMHTVNEALDKVEQLRAADLLLVDILLPSFQTELDDDTDQFYTGKAFLRKLRMDYHVTTPVIVLSIVSSSEELNDELKELGVVDTLSKLYTGPIQLKARVDALFAAS